MTDVFSRQTMEMVYSLPRVEILSGTVESSVFLWLFGEEHMPSLDVLVVVDDKSLDLTCEILSYEEVRNARYLFPEAQLVVGIVPRSVLERDWGEPLYMEQIEHVEDVIAMLKDSFRELGNREGITYLESLKIIAKFEIGKQTTDD